MDLIDYLSLFRKRWLAFVASVLLGILAAAAISLLTTPVFQSRALVFFAAQGASNAGELAQGSTYAEKQVQSYAEVATSPMVLQPVIERLGLKTTPAALAPTISVQIPQRTVIIEIAVSDTNPQRAADVANAVAEQLTRAVGDLTPRNAQGSETVRASVISRATLAASPSSPRVPRNLALGALLGAALGAGWVILRDRLDTKIRTEDDVRAVTTSSVIGAIPMDPDAKSHPLVVQIDPHSPRAESYRRLRTNLQFLEVGDTGATSLVVTSSVPGEGKSTTTINLAITLAEMGQSVLLIDGDMRRPMVAKYMGLEGTVGLTTVLIGQADLDDVVQPFGSGNLHVLAAGRIPPNPSELIASSRMRDLLDVAGQRYDVVLIDSPPLLPVTDSAILARITGGAVVVVGSDKIHRAQLDESLDSLRDVDAKVHGLVLNMIRRGGNRYVYDYQYKSGYAPDPDALMTHQDAASPDHEAEPSRH